jgi:hypothetical protein
VTANFIPNQNKRICGPVWGQRRATNTTTHPGPFFPCVEPKRPRCDKEGSMGPC